jgi:putative thioredoxin
MGKTIDISGEGQFGEKVLGAPPGVAVVVDFWATWCGPCKVLGPILERAVESLGDKALLAKVNTEDPANEPLGYRYQVRGIPAVKVFRGGELVTEFVGALPESQVNEILRGALPSDSDDLVRKGDDFASAGKSAEAGAAWREAAERDPRHSGAQLRLGRLAVERGDAGQARAHLEKISPGDKEHGEASALLARLGFVAECSKHGGLNTAQQQLDADPGNLDRRYAAAVCLAAAGRYEAALRDLLAIVARDRAFRDGAARKAMVDIFAIVGARSPLAEEYRTKLSRTLFS